MDRTHSIVPKNTLVTSEFGELRQGEQSIPYEIYEMATQNLGILSAYPLRVGERLQLELQGQFISVTVYQCAGAHEGSSALKRYRLVSFDEAINFEKFFSEQRNRSLANRIRMRHSRFPTAEIVPIVYAKTFGTPQVYKLKTVNASRSGMLLESCQGSDAPFTEGTLLEVKIQAPEEETISCLAKVVRCEWKHSGSSRLYGITLTDIPSEQKDSFQSFIEMLEQKSTEILRRNLSA